MFNMRSLILFSLIAVLGLFIIQNLSTVLPLIIFGVRTPALPLGVWVLGAIALGLISSLLLQLSSSFSGSRPRQLQRENYPENYPEELAEEPMDRNQAYGRRPYQNEKRSSPEVSADISDWDLDFGDDWQEETRSSNSPPKATDRTSETKQVSVSPPRAPAPYGSADQGRTETGKPEVSNTKAGKPEIGKSGVGRTEAVYDANYRVINAPFSPPPKVAKAQEEDWGLEEEDDSVFDFPEEGAKDAPPEGKKPSDGNRS